jgi:hypothetical protein
MRIIDKLRVLIIEFFLLRLLKQMKGNTLKRGTYPSLGDVTSTDKMSVSH